ncbi:MAG: hypothetical protein H6654_01740 [Ardenticatenaceae bacterium]|nr:hypothetical protein [Anaerolineales bacterium]MCB8940907.1 hypothetical protein [Ardenticatenaceae bacterium]MCB8972246.1 hypothetical protein [Ardenticatenaceae bacterium]
MVALRFDSMGSFALRWPSSYRAVVALGEAYVAYEGSLPPEAQLQDISLTMIEAALAEAKAAVVAAQKGERARASAGEVVQQTHQAIKPLLDRAIMQLKAQHFNHLAALEQWGLNTVMRQGKVLVRKPRTRRQWWELLQMYVAQEASLPPAEQISNPPLAVMQAHLQTLQMGLIERTGGRDQREMHVEARNTAVARLLDLLKAAAVIRLVADFNGVLTNELQLWGFQVNGRTSSGS